MAAPAERSVTRLDRLLTLGRDERCDIRIESTATSREHAQIGRDGPIFIVRDLGSKNGVHVDGKRLEVARLAHGSVVRAGGSVSVFIELDSEEAPAFRELAPGMLGGPTLAAVAESAKRAARSELHIVLEAESGSGKEGFARAIHDWSGRSGAFVAINCAAIPAHLAEAELFGYQKGAFTGAERNHAGYLRAAAGGTLFLDELLELPTAIQAKLLRAVERREAIPLGATQPVAVDVRIVAAAQRPLSEAVAAGEFRADLLARLSGITIRIPSLRERREDIVPLFWHFLRSGGRARMANMTPAAAELLCLHTWPLNVRELQAVAQRFAVLHPDASTVQLVEIEALLEKRLLRAPSAPEWGVAPLPAPPANEPEPEWQRFTELLAEKKGNVVRAAEALGISRQRAYRLLANHPGFDLEGLRRAH